MTVTSTARLALTQWSAGSDPFTRAQVNASLASLESLAAIDRQGVDASRPATGVRGTYYYATDTVRLYRDTGTAWYGVPVYRGTDLEELAVGTAARAQAAGLARLVLSTDGSMRALDLIADTATADTEPALRLKQSDHHYAFEVDNDGAIRAGYVASTSTRLTRDAYITAAPTSSSEVGIQLNHVTSPSVDLVKLKTGSATRFRVDPLGRIYLAALSDAANPSTPSGSGVLYCDSVGRLKYKGPGGTVTTLAEF